MGSVKDSGVGPSTLGPAVWCAASILLVLDVELRSITSSGLQTVARDSLGLPLLLPPPPKCWDHRPVPPRPVASRYVIQSWDAGVMTKNFLRRKEVEL